MDSVTEELEMKTIVKKLNVSNKTIIGLVIIIWIVMFILNHMTVMLVDDYIYSFSFTENNARITSLTQIISSMAVHYYTMNGRIVVHTIVHILLMLPPWIFDIINAMMFCLLCYVIYGYAWRTRRNAHNAFIFLMVFFLLCLFVPSFGEVFLWLTGSCNYLWSTTFLLLYLQPVHNDFSKEHTKLFWIIYILLGFCMGNLVETTSFAAIGYYFLWVIYKLLRKEKIKVWKLLPMATMIFGYLFMLFSPATQEGKIKTSYSLIGSILDVSKTYMNTYKMLLLAGLFMAVVLLLFGFEKKRLLDALIWYILSFGMNCMLSVASYRPGRSMIGIATFLIIALGIMLSMVFEHIVYYGQDSWMKMVTWFCRVVICYFAVFLFILFLVRVPAGVADIHDSYLQLKNNENYIKEQVEKGTEDIAIPTIVSSTDYSASHKLFFVDSSRCDTWPNNAMAKYYGAKRIYGVDSGDETTGDGSDI